MSTKMTPQLRFPEFTDVWQVKKLGDVADVSKLAGFEFTNYIKYSDVGNIIGLRGLNIKGGKLELSDVKYIDGSDFSKLNRSKLYVGDIMFTYVGTVGETAVIDEDDRYYLAPNVSRIRVRKDETNDLFIGSLIGSDRFQKNEIAKYISSSSQPALSMESIRKFSMTIPSKPEQEKIADFLTAVDERIAVGEKKLELLETYKRGVMQKIFSKQIRFEDENGSPYPDWEEKKAGALFRNISNRKHNGELPVLSITQDEGVVQRDSLERKINQSDTGVKNYKIIEPNDFVISLRSFQGGIEMSNILGISSPAYTVLRGNSEVIPGMFKHYFKRDEFISKLNSTVIGIRDGKQISYEPFSTIKLPVPYIEEQQKIADFLTTLDEKITAEKSKLTATKQFKKALLQRMFV